MTDSQKIVIDFQRDYFAILQEFFERATGCQSCEEFSSIDGFPETIHKQAYQLAKRARDAYPWGYQNIYDFLVARGPNASEAAKSLNGLKLVSGGSGDFTGTRLNSIRKTILYADTVIIPDPVLEWIITSRDEEKFKNVKFFLSVFTLLQLKPLIDADLAVPAIVVFPSWEKMFDEKDEYTRNQQLQLVTDVIALHSGQNIESFDDLQRFVHDKPDDFLKTVEDNQLFVGPRGDVGESLTDAITRYREDVLTWRTSDHIKQLESLGEHGLVLNGIMERLNPQFHLIRNANSLQSQPLLSLPVHAHYHSICSNLYAQRLEKLSLIDTKAMATIEALNSEKLRWLGNVPIDGLVVLRQNNENVEFRRCLQDHLYHLHESTLSDTGRVVSEVAQGISLLLHEHQAQLEIIENKYKQLHKKTAIGSWTTLAATLIPTLAPFLGLSAPFAVAAKYGIDKANEIKEHKIASKSLMGLLVEAESKNNV